MNSRYATLAACLVALAAASTGFTAAAGQGDGATVRLVAADDSIETGDATTYDVVVDGVDGTVGAYQLTLALDDPDVGTVVDVRPGGEPRMSDVSIRASGTEATVAAVGATVEPDDRVVIASVTVSASTVGTSALDLTVDALGDADGAAYDVATATGANVTVHAERDGSSGWNSDAGADDGSTDPGQSTADESAVDDAPSASTEDDEIASAETTAGFTRGDGTTDGSAGSPDATAETTAADGRATTADASDRTTGGASGATPGFGAATAVAALAAALVALRRLQ